jgi:hypothetical protein
MRQDRTGGFAPATESDILRLVEGRLAPAVIERLAALGLARTEINDAVIPATFQRISRCSGSRGQ